MRVGLILQEMWAGIRSNITMVVSIILVAFVSLTFVGVTMLLQAQVGLMNSYWAKNAQVAIYLCTDYSPESACPSGMVTDAEREAVNKQLESPALAPYIESYVFETQAEAYDKFVAEFGESGTAQYITAEQLNEAYWVNLKDPNQSDLLLESFSGLGGVEEIRDQRSYLDGIFAFLNAASLMGAGIAAVMLLSATLLISTTIRLSAISRSREIGIMRLVGASRFSIQLPFILEGVVAATIGGLLSVGATLAIVKYFVADFLSQSLAFTSFVGIEDALRIAPYLIGIGIGLAVLSSAVSIRRYLKA